ncbi:MAG: protein kinase [Nocardiopsaceae bacterium]|nr:protein kinase [Nocardiopsaceae bacterium]
MTKCQREDCGRGEIDYQGYCTECSRKPLPPPAERDDPPSAERDDPPPTQRQDLGRGDPGPGDLDTPTGPLPAPEAARARPEPWWGLDLIGHRSVPGPPAEPELIDTVVPEKRRFCANPECRRAVGRGHDGSGGRVAGFCPACGHRFDFARSRAGKVIAGRYEVRGGLGRGGQATAMLAHARSLNMEVVLKDLSGSSAAAATAELERDALVGLRHDSIVRIYGYEDEPDEGRYLVLEYVRGTPLSEPAGDPLEVVLGHGLQILHALDYLHTRGLLHMDVKPANIIRFAERTAAGPRDRVRLIDFGAVRGLRDPGPVELCTVGYPPPWDAKKPDPEYARPTAGFDLFCLGSTLRELCHPRPSDPGTRSLDLLLDRATDTSQPERRFVSARQFAEQLSGVIRQVVAGAPGGQRIIRPSALLASMSEPMHGGLGAPRPFGDWLRARVPADGGLSLGAAFATPGPAEAVAGLPAPVGDPDDPRLTRDALRECRTALREGNPDQAERRLLETRLPGWTWIRAWYAGLIELARAEAFAVTGQVQTVREKASTAAGQFQIVREALPGELIPQLALGLCAEIGDDLPRACDHYRAVAGTAPALGAAGFGLARTLLLTGRRAEAVTAAQRLAREFQAQSLRFENEARIAMVRLLAAVTDSSTPSEKDLKQAQELADRLPASVGPAILVNAEIQYGRSAATGDWLALSETLRELAKLAATRPQMYAVVDLANRLRPPVTWKRRRAGRKFPDHRDISRQRGNM